MTTDAEAYAIQQGRRAQDALETIGPHFAALRAGAMEKWALSSSGQTDLREKLFITVSTINAVEKALTDLVTSAAFAAQAGEVWNERAEATSALAAQGLTRP